MMSLKMAERTLDTLDTAQMFVVRSWADKMGVGSAYLVRVINTCDDSAALWANLDRIASTVRQSEGQRS
jgi:hypothetical protein